MKPTKEGLERLKEFGLFLALLGIAVLTIWIQFAIPSTGASLLILGAVIIFIAQLLERRSHENKKTTN